jgi:vacuolar-type H+-ATPase subunit F/Vma7
VNAPITAVCGHAAALGLGLAGLRCVEASDGAAAAEAIASLARAGGVILIERALYDALPAPLRRQIRRDGVPILMPFPGPSLAGAGPPPEEELLDLLRQAVGYRLRLR